MKRTPLLRKTPLRSTSTLKRSFIKARRRKLKPPSEIQTYWTRVARIGCIICGKDAQIHHCHGRELTAMGLGSGGGQKTSDWLVIPLCINHHTGAEGVDHIGVETWERRYGTQIFFLSRVARITGTDNLGRAGLAAAAVQRRVREGGTGCPGPGEEAQADREASDPGTG